MFSIFYINNKILIIRLSVFILLFFSVKLNAQITYDWNSFSAGGTSYSNIQSGGCTMNTTVNGVEFNAGAPKFDNAVGTNGTGLFLDHNWSTINSETNVVSTFAPALTNPSFTLYDINHNANTSDFCSNAWTDSVYITAIGATGASVIQTNPIQQTVFVSGTTIQIKGNAACNQTAQGSVAISFTGPVTQITIKYRSGLSVTRCSVFTPCAAASTPPCGTLANCTNPGRQFITIGDITGSSCCTGPTSGPTSVGGNTGPFCSATTTTLTASGAFANSQWHNSSCAGALIGTGTSLVVTPSVTTTYYINNKDCNGNPIGCTQITVTISPSPSAPTISNTGLNICAGQTTTLTSSSATGNNWSNGSTASSIVVSTAGTYTLTYTNPSGCTSSPASAVVSIIATPTTPTITAIGSPTACQGNNVILSSSATTGNNWSIGATTQTISVNTSGNYSVTLGSGSCSSGASFSVTIIPNPPTPTITNTGLNICAGQSTTLTSSGATGNNWSNGSTANSIVVSTAGTYTLTSTNSSGCISNPASAIVNIIPPPSTPTIIAIGSPTACQGNNVILSSSATTGNTWSTGATTQTISVSASGNYSVMLGSGTCSTSTNFSVTIFPAPSTPSISASSLSVCASQSITLSSSSASNNVWSTGATTSTIIVNTSGTYSLTLTNSNGCNSNPAIINITVFSVQPTPTITAIGSQTACQGNNVILNSSATTGNIWSTGATTQTISVNTSGNYSVMLGSGTCSTNANFSVTILPTPTNPTITSTGINLCAGQSATLTSSSLTGNNWSTGATTNSISVNSAGTYSLNFTNSSGCASPTATIAITISTVVVNVIVPSNTIVCHGAAVSISNFTSSVGGTVFNWQNSNPLIGLVSFGIGNVSAFTANNNSTNTATSVITVTPSASGCTGSPNSFTILVAPPLVVNAGVNDTVCFGGSVSLFVTPNGIGYNYNWSNGNSLSNNSIYNPIASPTITTLYTVTIIDANGCTGNDNVTILSNSQINTSIISSSITCYGLTNGSASASVIGGNIPYSYLWSNGQTTTNATNLSATNYTLIVKDAWGCLSSQTTTINQPPQLTTSISGFSATTCNNSCDGKANNTTIGGTGTYTYLWNTTPPQTSSNLTGLCAGNYTLVVKDANNCLVSTSVTISSPPLVAISGVPNVTICSGASATLVANTTGGNGGNYTYTWSPNLALSSSNNQTVVVSPTTSIVYSVTSSDFLGCTSTTQTVSVFVRAPLSLSINSNSVICFGNSAQLSASATGGIGSGYIYNWQTSYGLNNAAIANPISTPSVTTVYTITLSDGCSASVIKQCTVTVLALPVISFSLTNNNGCAPLCVDFTNTSTSSNGSFTNLNWNFGSVSSSTSQMPQYCFSTEGNYSVSLTVTDSYGCSASSTTLNAVHVYPNPIANFELPESVSLFENTVQIKDLSLGATAWAWNFNLNDPSSNYSNNEQNPIHYFPLQGMYCVGLKVINNYGCISTKDKCITIKPEFTIYVPNTFTPNADNINDDFYAYGLNIIEFEMTIFDRWGEQIFYSNDIYTPWNGKAKGGLEIAQQDVYVWKITAKDIFNKEHQLIGYITLLK